jgi:tRNA dimethylallyltransferase
MKALIVLLGPTGSGKTALSLKLAQRFGAEILSCDSVAVYRYMELGTAKPTAEERALIPHHCLDLYDPDEACTAGDYARHARSALGDLAERGVLPILSGGTGLYARALLDGLFPGPAANAELRTLLRARAATRGAGHLHRTLARLDHAAAEAIHPNDVPKMIRAIEVSVAARQPITAQWTLGRDALEGYRVLRLGLDGPRDELYARINRRAAAMFAAGLVEETRSLAARFGADCRPFESLGYAQASAVLRGGLSEAEAIAQTAQGHRNYAKRQMTWFRREAQLHEVHWLRGLGDSREIFDEAAKVVEAHLAAASLG